MAKKAKAKQTYIEGTEPYRIDEIEEQYKKFKDAEANLAAAKADRDDLREELVEMIADTYAAEIEENCGERGYVFAYGDEHRRLRVKPGEPALSDTKVKVEKPEPPEDDE